MPPQTDQKSSTNLTLVLDQGSHASRLVVFSTNGEIQQLETIEIPTNNTQHNYYEQDASLILASLKKLLDRVEPELLGNIESGGLCTQRSTLVAWHKQSGKPLSPAISWRDLRAQSFIKSLQPHANRIKQISGLPLSAHYSAGKMRWLLNNNKQVKEAAAEGQLCMAPLASFLLFHLLKQRNTVIDHSNAQRSQLFDIETLDWSDELLQLYQINKSHLPICKPVVQLYGELINTNIPITTVIGDQNAVIHAYPELEHSSALINIGTGAFILSRERNNPEDSTRLLRSISDSKQNKAHFLSEGTVNGAGAALSHAQEIDPCEQLFLKLPEWLDEIDRPPIYINTIAGLGSPWWCNGGKDIYISQHTNSQAERYVAIIESIVFLITSNIQLLESTPQILIVSGGLSQLDGLCQKLADLSQCKVMRYLQPEATARGCAWLANQLCKNNNLNCSLPGNSDTFLNNHNPKKYAALTSRYQQFVGELNKRCHSD